MCGGLSSGTFSPVFRAHGTRKTNQNEIWSYGADAQKILTKYDALRYRLMPYIYSLGWNVTHDGATILRPLVMDFPTDVRAQNIGDEYEFGPALLVSPVTEQERRPSISIYRRPSGTTSGRERV